MERSDRFYKQRREFEQAHIKYLENRLHDLASQINRYTIQNGCTPTQSAISESDRAEMEEFIENIKLLVNTLGHKMFEDKRETKSLSNERQTLYIKSSRGCDASGEQTSEGFVIFKGSKIAESMTPSSSPSIKKFRQELIDKNIISNFEFAEDFIFSSPSYAAAIALGRSANGLSEWKTADGRILKSLEEPI